MIRAHPSIHPFLILVAVLVCALAFAAPAFAWTHGQFSATTDACAGCHVAHAAQMPKLLKVGPTQTHFCFMCHGDGAASAPYDVEDGYTQATVGGAVYPSTAGGFIKQFVDADGDKVLDPGELHAVTSRHNVWGFVYGDESGPAQNTPNIYYWIPGGSNQFTGSGFVCSSCHDPHAGGGVPDGGYITGSATSPNPRLLRKSITVQDAAYTDLYVSFKFETVGTFTYGTPSVASGVYRVTEYVGGSAGWCGACHNKFQTDDPDSDPGEGHAVYYFNKWRHPVDVHVYPPPDFDGSVTTGTPLQTKIVASGRTIAVRNLGCLTCHRAHSSIASAEGWAASWPRDATDPATGKAQGDTSALLRMDNRGLCYNCHRAAQYNYWQDPRPNFVCSECHPGEHSYDTNKISCSTCHPETPELTGMHIAYDCSTCHNNLKEEAVCYQCHNDPAKSYHGINIQEKFTTGTATWTGQNAEGYYKKVNTRHDISDSDQLWSGTKVECTNCHNAHLSTRPNAYVDPDDRNSLWSQTTSDPRQGTVLDVTSFCLKCHDNTWAADGSVTGPAEICNIKTSYVSDQHGDAVGNRNSGYFNGYYKEYPRMLCTDCHDPHGGGGIYHLKTLTDQYGVPITITDPSAHEVAHWCSHCHDNPMGQLNSTKDGCISGNCHLHGSSSF